MGTDNVQTCQGSIRGDYCRRHSCQNPGKVRRKGKGYCGVHDPVRRGIRDLERRLQDVQHACARNLQRRLHTFEDGVKGLMVQMASTLFSQKVFDPSSAEATIAKARQDVENMEDGYKELLVEVQTNHKERTKKIEAEIEVLKKEDAG